MMEILFGLLGIVTSILFILIFTGTRRSNRSPYKYPNEMNHYVRCYCYRAGMEYRQDFTWFMFVLHILPEIEKKWDCSIFYFDEDGEISVWPNSWKTKLRLYHFKENFFHGLKQDILEEFRKFKSENRSPVDGQVITEYQIIQGEENYHE